MTSDGQEPTWKSCRTSGRRSSTRATSRSLGHRILLVIPEGNHTLGAFVAANQFRRYGLWVHLAIGQPPTRLPRRLRRSTSR
jgi:hypothetical protein